MRSEDEKISLEMRKEKKNIYLVVHRAIRVKNQQLKAFERTQQKKLKKKIVKEKKEPR